MDAHTVINRTALVRGVFEHLLEVNNPPLDASFFSLGGDSLDAIEAVMCLEERFGVDLPINLLKFHPTISAIVAFLGELEQARAQAA
ncbi:MAG: hypothetical protein BGN86_15750 [Caulobacterales bacterium 68-7]|nr:MAG: hypothetical protein BGN86_15750 [Caulobacterales bacterium 68-7]